VIGRHHLPWPVIQLATLLGAGDQDVLRWFTLAVASCSIQLWCSSSWRRRGDEEGRGGAIGRRRAL